MPTKTPPENEVGWARWSYLALRALLTLRPTRSTFALGALRSLDWLRLAWNERRVPRVFHRSAIGISKFS